MIRLQRRTAVIGMAAGTAGLLTAGARATRAAAGHDLERAKAEGKVVLYTSLDTKIVETIIAAFKTAYGIPVEYFGGGSNDVTARVLAEADAGRLQPDIVDASDVAALLLMKERRLLAPYRSAATDAVPANLKDPDGTWVADRLTQAVIQYNRKSVGQAPPKTWADLGDAGLAGRLTFFGSANGDGAPRLYTLAQHFGWALLERYAASKPLRVQTPQLVTQLLESGERAAAFATNDNIAWRSKREGKPTDFVYPAEGVPTELGAVGIIASSSRPTAARLFHDWWMGETGQALLVEGGKYSSRSDLAPPVGSPPLAELKLQTLDYAHYRKERAAVLERMTDIFGGEWGI